MAESISSRAGKRYAVVTGGNKGIGFEICRQLASEGVMVVLTARDKKRGHEALERLNDSGFSRNLIFHQLDVANPASIDSLVRFIKSEFGRLDILVNNAAIGGAIVEGDALYLKEAIEGHTIPSLHGPSSDKKQLEATEMKANGKLIQTLEMAEECVQTNYFGTKRMTEAFIPLLQLSHSPRIVNVSSGFGKLELLCNEWAKGVLSDAENLTEERVDEVLNKFFKDFKDGNGTVADKGWPNHFAAYKVSKAAMNAYTRIMAKKYPSFCINAVDPGYCKTDITGNNGIFTAAEGAERPVRLALLPDGSPSGMFFYEKGVTTF